MQLNEIIEENTLESICRKTRLSSENLEKLFARDFGAFRKVQALGFISILEREYRADLSDVRAECLAYFSEGAPVETTQREMDVRPKKTPIMDPSYRKKTPSYVKPALIGLIALGLLYGAWQTLSSSTAEDTNLTENQKSGFFASMVQQAKSWVGGDNNVSDTGALPEAAHGAWGADANATETTLVVAETPKVPSSNPRDTADKKDTQNESTIIRQVKARQAQEIAAEKSAEQEAMQHVDNAIANAGKDAAVDEKPLAAEVPSIAQASATEDSTGGVAEKAAAKVVAEATPKSANEEAVQKKAAEAARLKAEQKRAAAEKAARLKAEQDRIAAEKAAQAKAARLQAAKKKAAQEKAAREKAAKRKAAKEKAAKLKAAKAKAAAEAAAAKGKIVIRPRAKIWIGKVNLSTMQRSTVTTAKPIALDNLKGRWIVATGHGRFSLKIGTRVFNFNDSKKHFLIIQKGTAHEIPHATFQKLNQSKVW